MLIRSVQDVPDDALWTPTDSLRDVAAADERLGLRGHAPRGLTLETH